RAAIAALAQHRVDVADHLLELVEESTEEDETRVVALRALVDLNSDLARRGIEVARQADSSLIKSAAIQQMARI
ncbi:MAG: hypothetical protein GWN58_42725, partial [Anaerolineae bacterium]|nr:hypothetical protein [Anaerolineae bacterium]